MEYLLYSPVLWIDINGYITLISVESSKVVAQEIWKSKNTPVFLLPADDVHLVNARVRIMTTVVVRITRAAVLQYDSSGQFQSTTLVTD